MYRVIVACCVLHNIAHDRNQHLDDDELNDLPLEDDVDDDPIEPNATVNDALIRQLGFAKGSRITLNTF